MEPIEVTAKKVDDAIREGLKLLNTTIDKVEYTIISSGGLFKKAKISIALVSDETEKKGKKGGEKSPEFNKNVVFHEEKEYVPTPPKSFNQTMSQKSGNFGNNLGLSDSLSGQPKANSERPFKQEAKDNQPKQQNKEKAPQPNQERFAKAKHQSSQAAEKPQSNTAPSEEVKKRTRTVDISEEATKKAAAFVSELVGLMGLPSEVVPSISEGDLILDVKSDSGALIGYRGETLDAIEYLTSIHLNKNNDEYVNVVIDSCGYRKNREKMLVAMADRAASKCLKIERKVVMEPMNRSSRKVVHSSLSKHENLSSRSEGIEPNRHVVIYFKRGQSKK